jgi:hypothetical protein
MRFFPPISLPVLFKTEEHQELEKLGISPQDGVIPSEIINVDFYEISAIHRSSDAEAVCLVWSSSGRWAVSLSKEQVDERLAAHCRH